ncbi:hypothetical protein DIPPA_11749 [Diplonema papillatum]|nr:hypothetical protein DIPPA_11749 [Diplonema papillatum]
MMKSVATVARGVRRAAPRVALRAFSATPVVQFPAKKGPTDEDAVMRPANEGSEETLASEKAKEKKIAEKKMLSDKEEKLNDKVEKLNDKEKMLNTHISLLRRWQREKSFQSVDLGDTLEYFSTRTPSAEEVAAILQTLTDSKLSVQRQLTEVQGQLTEVQKQLTFLLTTAEAPPQNMMSLEDLRKRLANCKEKLRKPHRFCSLAFGTFQAASWDGRKVIVDEFNSCKRGEYDKQKRHIIFVGSGMGSGKSRVLTELSEIVKPLLDPDSEFIELRVNFENSTGLREGENDANVEKVVLDRIMLHLIGKNDDVQSIGRAWVWGFSLGQLVIEVQECLKEGDANKTVFVLVSVDGAHQLDTIAGCYRDESIYSDRQGWYRKSRLRQLFVVIHRAMVSGPHVMCAVSSTVTLPVLNVVDGSNTMNKRIIQPPAMTSLPSEIENAFVRKHAAAFVSQFGEHPRTMEFLMHTRADDMAGILQDCATEMNIRYDLGKDLEVGELNDLLRYSLSAGHKAASPVGNKGRVVDDMLGRGLLTLVDTTLRISPVFLYSLHLRNRAATQFPVLCGWKPLVNDICASSFEEFVGFVQCVRSHVFKDEQLLQQFLHGVRWLTSGNPYVVPAPLAFVKAKHQLHTDSKNRGQTLSKILRLDNPDHLVDSRDKQIPLKGHCVQNAAQASAGDLFFLLDTPTEQKIHVVTQAKHGGQGVGEARLSEDETVKNAPSAAVSGDVYLLVTKKKAPFDEPLRTAVAEGVHVGVVDSSNFESHFGPFSKSFAVSEASAVPSVRDA